MRRTVPILLSAASCAVLTIPLIAATSNAQVASSLIPDSAQDRAPTYLNAVSARSATDAWAVGSHRVDINTTVTWTQHWDGTAWNIVSTPNPDRAFSSRLESVSALSADDVWAVGRSTRKRAGSTDSALIEHWNGSRWKVLPGDAQQGGSSLRSVSAVSPTTAWTVGGYVKYHSATLIEYWDGTTWTE